MNEYDKKQLLLNAMKIAYSDSILTTTEESALENLRTQIKATKTVFKRVVAEVDEHSVDLLSLSRFSLRMRSIEDMFDVALADGNIGANEIGIIRDAAGKIGLSDLQIERLKDESLLRAEVSVRVCSACASSIDSGAKFCPACGISVSEERNRSGKQLELNIPKQGVTVAFAESTAGGFPKALKAAKTLDTYQSAVRVKTVWHAVTIGASDKHTLVDISDQIGGMRNKELYIKGNEVDWRDNMQFVGCAMDRAQAYDGVKHCFGLDENSKLNVWGCRRLRMDWSEWSDLFTFGEFIKKDVFKFDHDRIQHELQNRLRSVRLCPHIRVKFCGAVMRFIPHKAKVIPGGAWEYRRSWEEADPRGIKVTIVRDYGDGYKDKESFVAVGVIPKDPKLPSAIIQKAAKLAGAKEVSLKSLGL